ncbi:MAG: 23S rRNA (guanosine(2251)-2'-O)-methyltransferase RlmB [Acholeplasmataceae bacterium]|jgi:predicted rRNA methylase|nr:23S rRNA (guanosine(2251)-2'-O)-methyltransferase RlmB [Acholeplasmataceae bacterium]MCK9233700.1 23S rRNA (guanosine(2251)-2'-O)-methyltransferase RlmB [Acholeplasmataceae bacterium]MCK9288827.1 23S rRNA (guanosine(2251)-2'-O)-methyltransferase RlmB [Acholeplasmataceae bacterium]MCK9427267.1 23S rRNA (guanosine(2251)-2'-O)-methyltransferase RlmB [Acholeplasmataceae bacterium]MDD4090093.1 23S rRNA (guanosine(2251)-2'-O)-methyltransferase RlmB [Acholeplasmataceae bacterium]
MIIYGKNTTKEVILKNRPIYKVYLDNKFQDREIINLLRKNEISFLKVSKHELNLLTNNAVHQGIVMEVQDYESFQLEEVFTSKMKTLVLLDKIFDPQNLGAIIRTVEAFKVDGLIIAKKRQAQITPLVAKVASGALEYVKIILVDNLYQTVRKLKEQDFYIIGTSLEGEEISLKMPLKEKNCLIMGSEGRGISYMLEKSSDVLVKIPMQGKINSLNVSVATGILLYQLTQKK